jgi:hypothetical protein
LLTPTVYASSSGNILWRNQLTGENAIYNFDSAPLSIKKLPKVATRWQLHQGDFDGDGDADLLWRDYLTGKNWIYLLQSQQVLSSSPLNVAANTWKVAALGDLNGDSKDDIVWRNSETGAIWLYLMNGNKIAQSVGITNISDPDWQLVGASDFNGDGTDDLFLRHRTEQTNIIYSMKDGRIDEEYQLNNVSNSWMLSQFADINGDGTSDLIWRHQTSGVVWFSGMNNGLISQSRQVNTVGDLSWKIVASGDFDNNGFDDLLWRHQESGKNVIYYMRNGEVQSIKTLNRIQDTNWKVVAKAGMAATDYSQSLNPGLQGRLFYQKDNNSAYLMDLASGKYRLISGTNWEDQDDRIPLGTNAVRATPSLYVNRNMMLTVAHCRSGGDALAPDYSCLIPQNYSGEYGTQTDIVYDPMMPAKLSRNGQHFAYFRRWGISSTDDHLFEIYDLSGDLVSQRILDGRDFEWMLDDSLVYIEDNRTIGVTGPLSTNLFLTLTLPDSVVGNLADLSLSPDGKRLAFFMLEASTPFASVYGLVYTLDLETGNIYLLATMPEEEGSSASIYRPQWSPDGKWLLVTVGGSTGQDGNSLGTLPYLYTIPTNLDYVATLSIDDAKKSPAVIRLKRYDQGVDLPGSETFEKFPKLDYYWLP